MAGSLPLVRNGAAQCLYPVRRSVEFATDIAMALDSTEQRSRTRPPLTRFQLGYTRINATETAAMKAFFESQKGQFDSTWSFTLGATTYAGLTFEDPAFTAREDAGAQLTYSFNLRCRQVKNPGQTAGAAGAAFPTLANGLKAQLPYVQSRRFQVLLNDNPASGTRYSWTWFSGGLTGFPTRSLRGWELNYPVLSDADLATIETHFRNNWGRYASWSFTDPDDGAVYTKCRYDIDSLEITYQQPNVNSVTLRVMETN